MRKSKLFALVVSVALIISMLVGCGSSNSGPAVNAPASQTPGSAKDTSNDATQKKDVKITIMNSKAEIQTPMEEAAKAFESENPGIKVEVVPCPQGKSPYEMVSALYASNSAPSLAILDKGDLELLKDNALDLSGEKWVNDTPFAEDCKIDGKLICFPVVVEGCGLIYNKAVLDKAGVDPESIKTQQDLEEALKKIEATGVSGCIIGAMDWSLGNHLHVTAWANKSESSEQIASFLEDLKAGKVDLTQDKDFNGLVSTFDILMKYNKAKDDPLSPDSNKCAEIIANGQAGFLFQGNWTWPEMNNFQADPNNFGIIPLPVSSNVSDIANNGIQVGPTKYAIVDKAQNDVDQQAAAKKFLEWMVYSKTGNEAIVTNANCIMAFKNVDLQPSDPLGKSIAAAIKGDKTLVFVGNLVPSDHWKNTGAAWQKYLAGMSDKDTLAKEIMDYWKSVK